jgi:hypothetical protein
MDGSKIRFTTSEAKAALGIGNTKFWSLVKAGELQRYFDGNKAYISAESLKRYDLNCRANTTPPDGKRRGAEPGSKGVKARGAQ